MKTLYFDCSNGICGNMTLGALLEITGDQDYLKNALLEESGLDLFGDLPECKVVLPDGEDKTELVEKCVNWLKEYSF